MISKRESERGHRKGILVGPSAAMPVKRPVVHKGACGTWRYLADLCLPECYRSTTCAVCGLERERTGKKKIEPVAYSIEYSLYFASPQMIFFSVPRNNQRTES